MDAGRPVLKAIPLNTDQVRRMLLLLPEKSAALLELCWQTASRVNDVMTLTGRCLELTPEGLLVKFKTTKANREAAPRVDHFALIQAPSQRLQHLAKSAKMDTPLFKKEHATALSKLLRKQPVPPSLLRPANRTRYTLHSVKRGAAALLWQAASTGDIPVTAVSCLLKHRSLDTSMGYCPNPQHAAMAMGLHRATRHLSL